MKANYNQPISNFISLLAIISSGLYTGCDSKTNTSNLPAPKTSNVNKNAIQSLSNEEIHYDKTVFNNELEAQAYESTFVALWDKLRTTEPFKVFRQFPFAQLELPLLNKWSNLTLGVENIRQAKLNGEKNSIDHPSYLSMIDQIEKDGWRVKQTEWHHTEFRPASNGQAPISIVSYEIHATNIKQQRRAAVKGELKVTWSANEIRAGLKMPGKIQIQNTTITDYTGNPAFTKLIEIDPKKIKSNPYPRVTPIMVHDLDKDGQPEIILAGSNLVYRNKNGEFKSQPMLKHPLIPLGEAGILADFNGDGEADFVSTSQKDGLLRIWEADAGGIFNTESRIIFDSKFENPHTMTTGDVDLDGDLDLFIGQWKQPYMDGSMPTPYYNANDGYPDALLINDGNGNFNDKTESAGLAPKRNRRTYSASFADLDGDKDLDLFCVCDFSGIDVYHNNGKGSFTDMTDQLVKERHGFGMGHTISDFNGDGMLDIYMVGMSSTTARRLDRLNLGRKGFEKNDSMRAPMTYGNRLYFGSENGFHQPRFSDDVARTGWSWGTGAADFDNDGDLDIYVANGHLSGNSALDYCTRFWCHDVYTGTSKPNETLETFFSGKLSGLGSNYSWNGFEHNHLFLNNNNNGFSNVAFLFGTAFEFDARAVITADINVDGRNDLLVVQYDANARQQRLFVMLNQLSTKGKWIGLHVNDEPGQPSNGVTVKLFAKNQQIIKQFVTGDSFTAQHPSTAHFGLGENELVEKLEINWPSGKTKILKQPELGRYHQLTP